MSLRHFISTNVAEPAVLTEELLVISMRASGGLQLPAGFEWDLWNPAIVCCDCGIVFSALAPTVDMEQRAYDEMAAEHRRRCPGDGA